MLVGLVPIAWRAASYCAGVARSPTTLSTGSIGITRPITKVTSSSPSSVSSMIMRWSPCPSAVTPPAIRAARVLAASCVGTTKVVTLRFSLAAYLAASRL